MAVIDALGHALATALCRLVEPDLAAFLRHMATDGAIDRRRVKGSRLGVLRFLEYPRAMHLLGLTPGARLLDVGSSFRPWPVWALARGARVVVTDLDPRPLARFREIPHVRAAGSSLAAVVADATRLPFRSGAFDLASSISVLEHIERDADAAREIGRALAPGGRAVLTVPIGREELVPPANPFAHQVLRCYTGESLRERLVGPSGLAPLRAEHWRLARRVPPDRYARTLWRGALFRLLSFRRVASPAALADPHPHDTAILALEKRAPA